MWISSIRWDISVPVVGQQVLCLQLRPGMKDFSRGYWSTILSNLWQVSGAQRRGVSHFSFCWDLHQALSPAALVPAVAGQGLHKCGCKMEPRNVHMFFQGGWIISQYLRASQRWRKCSWCEQQAKEGHVHPPAVLILVLLSCVIKGALWGVLSPLWIHFSSAGLVVLGYGLVTRRGLMGMFIPVVMTVHEFSA